MPKFSIITVNYNNYKGLIRTIESVMSQTFTDYEYIIIDGGSTDGSAELIKKHCDKIAYWVSEKDDGIYNAMNKGILKATGEYCYFLNSGDCLAPDVLKMVFENCCDDIVYGNVVSEESQEITYGRSLLALNYFFSGTIFHQAAFIKRTLFDKVGLYSEHFKVISDWEFFLKAICLERCSYLYVNINFASFESPGASSQDFTSNKRDREKVLKQFFPLYYDDYILLTRFSRSNFSGVYKVIENNKFVNFFFRCVVFGHNVSKSAFKKIKTKFN